MQSYCTLKLPTQFINPLLGLIVNHIEENYVVNSFIWTEQFDLCQINKCFSKPRKPLVVLE